MGIRDLLATYQTEYFTTPERAQSVMMPAQYASNVLVAPGEEYNLDEQIGPRTAERGFVQAIGVTNPGEYEDVLGGALTQVATTLFNAALLAGLEITERHNHSIYIDHYPLGLDATVTASSKNPKNLRFKNNTDHYILIQGWSDGGHTRFSIYGTDDGRKSTMVASDFFDVVPCTLEPEMRSDSSLGIGTTEIAFPGQSEMKVLVTRTVTWPSGSTTTDTFVSTWGTLRQVIKVGTSTTTTLAPVGTTTATTVPPAT
jgi:vancomycin resistance protein YoaR